jgi:hypothetical protein
MPHKQHTGHAMGQVGYRAQTGADKATMRKTTTLGLGVLAVGGILLGGCSSEIGRLPSDTDISCLRKQMAGPMFLSFPLAANTCQRLTNHNLVLGEKDAKLIPLNLKGAPDLQKLAQEYGYSYTP